MTCALGHGQPRRRRDTITDGGNDLSVSTGVG